MAIHFNPDEEEEENNICERRETENMKLFVGKW